jgi:phage-related protein
LDIYEAMKPVTFLGSSLKCLRDMPADVRHNAGYQLSKIQSGQRADDFKPMPAVGPGVEEIRIFDDTGAYRVIYLARLPQAVFVLHVFQKKTQGTPLRDIALAKARYRDLMKGQK